MSNTSTPRKSSRVSIKTEKAASGSSKKKSQFQAKYCAPKTSEVDPVLSDDVDELVVSKSTPVRSSARRSIIRTTASPNPFQVKSPVMERRASQNTVKITPTPAQSKKRKVVDDSEDELPEKKRSKVNQSDDDELTRDTLQTPTKRTMKKVLVGANRRDTPSPTHKATVKASERKVNDSPSKVTTPSKLRISSQVDTPESAKQLFKTPTKTHSPSKAKVIATVVVPQIDVTEEEVSQLKSEILPRITGRQAVPLVFRDTQYTAIHTLLRETIVRAESNSALIVGPHSSGKSLIVESALSSFDDTNELLIVRLNGSIQTDEKQAIRAIARQLQPDGDHESIANADIMTALLAILSHPSEFGESGNSVSIVIILDEFSRFSEQPRQTLLYNLFDIAQSKKAPICVLGLTTRIDAFDALEKRVKSRFSHRIVQTQHLKQHEFTQLARSVFMSDFETEYAKHWNQYISTQPELDRLIDFVYLTSKDVREVWSKAVIPMMQMYAQAPFVSFTQAIADQCPRQAQQPPPIQQISHLPYMTGKLESVLPSLSTIEMSLLIASSRVTTKDQRLNFSTCFNEYRALSQKTTVSQRLSGVTNIRSYGKKLCRGAFERLLDLRLLLPMPSKLSFEYRPCKVDVLLLDLQQSVRGHHGYNISMTSWLTL